MIALVGALTLSIAAANGNGTVVYATTSEAYLNVGTRAGLAAGNTLTLTRRGRKVGSCEVTSVSPRSAVCRGERIDRGDRFTFLVDDSVIPPPRPKEQAPKPRAPLPTATELEQKRAAVLDAPIALVPFEKDEAVTTAARASVMLREQVWYINTNAAGAFARTSIDASAKASLGLGMLPTAYGAASLRVTGDLLAPPDQRMRPGELVELYLWGASVGTSDGPVIAELGRFYPRMAPGLSLLDGAQVGARFLGASEAGVYAGVIPDLITTMPSAERLAAGVYLGTDAAPLDELLVLPRLRAGVASTRDFGVVRGELEAQAQLVWLDVLTLGGSMRGGVGGTPELAPSLDAARADVSVSATSSVTIAASYRYLAPLVVDYDAVSNVAPVGGAHHAGGTIAVRPFDWLSLGLVGGTGFDLVSDALRTYLGPELGLPRLFGAWGGMELGYLEEIAEPLVGWPGRSAWLSAHLAPVSVLRLGGRISYFEAQSFYDSLRELAAMTSIDAPVLAWLTLRGRGGVQQALPTQAPMPRTTPTILVADLAVIGAF